MSQKYHINSQNKVAPCRAKAGSCPFGSEENHFPTEKSALIEAEKRLTEKSSILVSIKKTTTTTHGSATITKTEEVVVKTNQSRPTPNTMKNRAPTSPSAARKNNSHANTSAGNNSGLKRENSGGSQHSGGNNSETKPAFSINKKNFIKNTNPTTPRYDTRRNSRPRKNYFRVVGRMKEIVPIEHNKKTEHFSQERQERVKKIEKFCGEGKPIAQFVIDKKHNNGFEVHQINSNGVINVYNRQTGRHITDLIARPAQVKRCYESMGEAPPKKLMLIVSENTRRGYNNL